MPPRKSSPHSSSANAAEQPRTCFICGKPVKTTETVWWHFDDTPAKLHRSWHTACRFESIKKAP